MPPKRQCPFLKIFFVFGSFLHLFIQNLFITIGKFNDEEEEIEHLRSVLADAPRRSQQYKEADKRLQELQSAMEVGKKSEIEKFIILSCF